MHQEYGLPICTSLTCWEEHLWIAFPTCRHPCPCHEEMAGGGPCVLSRVVEEEVDPFQYDYVECLVDHSDPHWDHDVLGLLFDHPSNHLHWSCLHWQNPWWSLKHNYLLNISSSDTTFSSCESFRTYWTEQGCTYNIQEAYSHHFMYILTKRYILVKKKTCRYRPLVLDTTDAGKDQLVLALYVK